MNGTLRVGSALAALFAALLVLAPAHTAAPPAAEAPAEPARPTRVAIFNLTKVLKNYGRFKQFEAEMRKEMEKLKARFEEKKALGRRLAEEMEKGELPPDQKAAVAKRLKAMQRELEDLKSEGSEKIMRKQGEQLKALFRDIQAATRSLARKRGYDLVLQYNDAVTPEQLESKENIARKMSAGALMPVYAGPGVDITAELIKEMNRVFRMRSA